MFVTRLALSRSGRPLHLSDHHVPAGQEHPVAVGDDEGAAAGEGERGVGGGAAAGDAGGAREAAGAAEAASGPGAEAAGAVAGDRGAERPAGRAGAQAQGTDGQCGGLLLLLLHPCSSRVLFIRRRSGISRGRERPVSQTTPQVLGSATPLQTPA